MALEEREKRVCESERESVCVREASISVCLRERLEIGVLIETRNLV